jgi:ParB-like nuclease domain
MKVELWPIERPIPYARNARKISDAAVDKVAASIKEFGWRQSIVVDADGVIVAGHTRLLAARKLGLAQVPIHVATDLTPAQVKAYRLMDNRSHEEAQWDEELLGLELEELEGLDLDLKLTGFGDDELAKFLNGLQTNAPSGFGEYDETIETEHQCPKCGYRWSGGASSGRGDVAQQPAHEPILVEKFALPDDDHSPAIPAQSDAVPAVAPDVPVEPVAPEFDVALRNGSAGPAATMPMPETAVHEDDGAPAGKHDVRRTGKRSNGKAKPKAEAMQDGADGDLRPRVATANSGH